MIRTSLGTQTIAMSEEMEKQMHALRSFMFENVYKNPAAKGEETKAIEMQQRMYEYFCEHPEKMSGEFISLIARGEKKERVVCDYISGMTDQFAIRTFTDLFVPTSWQAD